MLQAKAPFITRYDYQEMPQGPPYYQVIEGDLIMSPSPNTFHQVVLGRIYSIIVRYLEKNPIGEAFFAPLDVFLSDINVYQPDVILVSNERRSIITDHGIEGAPDVVVAPAGDARDRVEFPLRFRERGDRFLATLGVPDGRGSRGLSEAEADTGKQPGER